METGSPGSGHVDKFWETVPQWIRWKATPSINVSLHIHVHQLQTCAHIHTECIHTPVHTTHTHIKNGDKRNNGIIIGILTCLDGCWPGCLLRAFSPRKWSPCASTGREWQCFYMPINLSASARHASAPSHHAYYSLDSALAFRVFLLLFHHLGNRGSQYTVGKLKRHLASFPSVLAHVLWLGIYRATERAWAFDRAEVGGNFLLRSLSTKGLI